MLKLNLTLSRSICPFLWASGIDYRIGTNALEVKLWLVIGGCYGDAVVRVEPANTQLPTLLIMVVGGIPVERHLEGWWQFVGIWWWRYHAMSIRSLCADILIQMENIKVEVYRCSGIISLWNKWFYRYRECALLQKSPDNVIQILIIFDI